MTPIRLLKLIAIFFAFLAASLYYQKDNDRISNERNMRRLKQQYDSIYDKKVRELEEFYKTPAPKNLAKLL